MPLNQILLPELDQETGLTRKIIEKLPADKWAWKPHEKSYSLGDLTSHIVNIANWGLITMQTETFDIAPPGEEPPASTPANTPDEALAFLDQAAGELKEAIAAASDTDLMQTWTMLQAGNELFSMPRLVVLRSFVFNHSIHHRAQLSLYLRLLDLPMPNIYGPTADEA